MISYMQKYLYHASTNKSLKRLEPQRSLSKDKYIGDYVFATPDRRMSIMYLVPGAAGAISINTFNGEPYAFINGTPEQFEKVDHGGAIYKVQSEQFNETPQQELIGTEYVSVAPVPIVSKEKFSTAADAMRKNGVKLYFFEDDEMFQKLISADDHGLKLLQSIKPYIG